MSSTTTPTTTGAPAATGNGFPPPPGYVPAPTPAFQGVSWFAFALGALGFLYATWYAPDIAAADRYFLYCAFLFSCFGCLSVSKAVRDKQEGIPISGLFFGLSFVAAIVPFVLVTYNLAYDSPIPPAYGALLGMAYALSAFAVLAIAKNERDRQAAKKAAVRVPLPVPTDK